MDANKATPQKLTAKQNLWQSVKFLLFSTSAGIIQVALFTLLNELANLPYWPAYLIALIASVVYNFTVNRRYTFRSDANIPVAMTKLLLYYAIFTPVSTVGGEWLTNIGWNEYLVLAITMIANFVTEFLVSRFWLYGNSIDTNDLAKKENTK